MHTAHEMSQWSAFSLHESIFDAVASNIAILNDKGEIIAVNDAWMQFAEFNELPLENYGLGLNYISLCESLDAPDAVEARQGLRDLLAGEIGGPIRHEYQVFLATGAIWVRMTATRVSRDDRTLVILANEDVTLQRHTQAALGRATAALLHAEDDERRRIARELHDGTAQYLTGAKLDARRDEGREPRRKDQGGGRGSADQRSGGDPQPVLRAASAGAGRDRLGSGHPADGGRVRPPHRPGLQIDIADDFPKMARPIEVALYRVAQEALANVHRHAGSPRATIGLRQAGEMVLLSIRDYGVGLPEGAQATAGVGLAGMRLRLEFVNGHISLNNVVPGLLVEAWAPFQAKTN
jgi:two-component system NarL family sensor kinase